MPNESPDLILVSPSKLKIALACVGSAVFVAAGLLMWTFADRAPLHRALYLKAAAGACVGFFGLCGVFALLKLFDTAPGLIVDAEGIVDRSSLGSVGRIPWSDIRGFKVTTVRKQRFLTVEVHNPEKYVQRASLVLRPLVAVNARYFGSPVQISSHNLKINFDELVSVLSGSYAKYRRDDGRAQTGHPIRGAAPRLDDRRIS
jgi:hypothetical protein